MKHLLLIALSVTTVHLQTALCGVMGTPNAPADDQAVKRTMLLQRYRADDAINFLEIDGIKIGLDKQDTDGNKFFDSVLKDGILDLMELGIKERRIEPTTVLERAIRNDNPSVAKMLYAYIPENFTLQTALWMDDVDVAKEKLPENLPNLNLLFHPHCESALCTKMKHRAGLYNAKSVAMARLLVNNGARPTKEAVQSARERGYPAVAKYLADPFALNASDSAISSAPDELEVVTERTAQAPPYNPELDNYHHGVPDGIEKTDTQEVQRVTHVHVSKKKKKASCCAECSTCLGICCICCCTSCAVDPDHDDDDDGCCTIS